MVNESREQEILKLLAKTETRKVKVVPFSKTRMNESGFWREEKIQR